MKDSPSKASRRAPKSRATRHYSYQRNGVLKRVHIVLDKKINSEMGTTHHFTIFRMGMDACAKCGKTRAEHG